jgi:hypothetical protein
MMDADMENVDSDGVIDDPKLLYDHRGVDRSLIRAMLAMTPLERLHVLQKFLNALEEIEEYRATQRLSARNSRPRQAQG